MSSAVLESSTASARRNQTMVVRQALPKVSPIAETALLGFSRLAADALSLVLTGFGILES